MLIVVAQIRSHHPPHQWDSPVFQAWDVLHQNSSPIPPNSIPPIPQVVPTYCNLVYTYSLASFNYYSLVSNIFYASSLANSICFLLLAIPSLLNSISYLLNLHTNIKYLSNLPYGILYPSTYS